MSEERSNYMDLEHALETVETRLRDITTDPTASYWLKQAVTELWERDVVDALNDLDVLRDLPEEKYRVDGVFLGKFLKPINKKSKVNFSKLR